MNTVVGTPVPQEMLYNYLCVLVNQFYKILPMKENGEPSLNKFVRSLQLELLGCSSLVEAVHNDAMFLSLISILQYIIENECETAVVKREVFKAISICKKLQTKYLCKGA